MRPGLICAVAGMFFAAPAGGEPGTAAFGPGEQSTYRVAHLKTLGTLQITVGAQTTRLGRQVLPLVTVAKSDPVLELFPIHDRFVSYWDSAREQCAGNDLYADENHKRRRERIFFDHELGTAVVSTQAEGRAVVTKTVALEPNALDILSATFALRNSKLEVGSSVELPVFTVGRTFRLRAVVDAKETIDTALGPREVFRLRVRTGFGGDFAAARELRVWMTADEARVPVRVEADFALGSLRAELTDYKPGRR